MFERFGDLSCFSGSGVIDGTTFLFLSFFLFSCLCFSSVPLRILISFVTRKYSGMRISGKEVLRIFGSFIKSSGTILSPFGVYHFCTATPPRSTSFCGSYFGFSLSPSLIFFEKETSYLLVIFCATLFLFTYTFNYLSFDASVYLGSFFVFFVYHLISEQGYEERRDTVAFFSDGLVVSRHPVLLLLCTLDTSTALSFFRYGGVRRPDQLYY